MSLATLEIFGDAEERKHWPEVRKCFPLYKRFWQTHVLTLRDERGRIRADVDERLELMAQEHYKCFLSVGFVSKGRFHSTREDLQQHAECC
jgi:hypothetical protein